jgi:hypothetical protein
LFPCLHLCTHSESAAVCTELHKKKNCTKWICDLFGGLRQFTIQLLFSLTHLFCTLTLEDECYRNGCKSLTHKCFHEWDCRRRVKPSYGLPVLCSTSVGVVLMHMSTYITANRYHRAGK